MWKNPNLIQSNANGNSFEDKGYHGIEQIDSDRSIIKEFKNYNEIEPGSFVNGIYRSFNHPSTVQKSPQSFIANCPSDSGISVNMLQQFDNNNPSLSNLRPNSDQQIADELWFYLDPRSNVQGPFLDTQMFQWWSQGIYFQNSLLMKRKCDADFSTLQDYSKRFSGVPFNRKDIRVSPLTESLSSVQSPNNSYTEPKIYANGPVAPMHRNTHQVTVMNDPKYILQLMSSAPNQSAEEITKLLHKTNIQQRLPSQQLGYEQTLVSSSIHNGPDPFLNSQAPAYIPDLTKTGQIATYTKNERFPSLSWTQMHQQKLNDSVWTSTSDDTILSSNPVWSRSTTETLSGGPSLLNSIFHETLNAPNNNNSIPTTLHKSSTMQESWDNLDPAIIKIIPHKDATNHLTMDNKLYKETRGTMQMEQSCQYNVSRTHSDNVKPPWAELVRKGSIGNQKSKSGFNCEHDIITNHSLSPHKHKDSVSSSSSDEYDHARGDSSDKDLESLIHWCKTYVENKPGITGVDIGTLIELLIYVESPYEMEATMRENVPEFDNIPDFVKIFIEKRRPLRLKLFSDNPKKKSKSPPKMIDDDTKWQVKSKSHGSCKKKRKNNNTKN